MSENDRHHNRNIASLIWPGLMIVGFALACWTAIDLAFTDTDHGDRVMAGLVIVLYGNLVLIEAIREIRLWVRREELDDLRQRALDSVTGSWRYPAEHEKAGTTAFTIRWIPERLEYTVTGLLPAIIGSRSSWVDSISLGEVVRSYERDGYMPVLDEATGSVRGRLDLGPVDERRWKSR